MFFRQAEPSGVWWRHQLEGGRKTGSMGLQENDRSDRVTRFESGDVSHALRNV